MDMKFIKVFKKIQQLSQNKMQTFFFTGTEICVSQVSEYDVFCSH